MQVKLATEGYAKEKIKMANTIADAIAFAVFPFI